MAMPRILGLVLLGSLLVSARQDTKADALWNRITKTAEAGAFDESRALVQAFIQKYPGDPRFEEAGRRFSGNAFLGTVPYCVAGPKENRIDVCMSADGLLSVQKDQELLRRIAVNTFEDAMRLHPFDVYWPYFNWYITHAGSRKNGLNPRAPRDDYDTCFGGMHGDKDRGGNDACMDFEHARDRILKPHLPDCDFFLVRVEGHNGWPPPWGMCAAVVGTSHLRYAPQALSGLRLDDGELPGYDLILPALKDRFARAWDEFQRQLQAERVKVAALSVREWRKRTKTRPVAINVGAGDGELRFAVNSVTDKRHYPGTMKLADRPFPDFRATPWFHWLEKGEPSATIYPLLLSGLWNVKSKDFRGRSDGDLELSCDGAKLEEIKRQCGGRLPTTAEIGDKMYITYYSHDRCFLGAYKIEDRGNPATQFCSPCLEETILSMYRKVSPIDSRVPKEDSLPLPTAKAKAEFCVELLKPADHFLSVEWRVDGKVQATGTERRVMLRDAHGGRKRIQAPPVFQPQARSRAAFDPARESPGVNRGLIDTLMLAARITVEERFVFDAAAAGPGTHAIEVTVVDETPWVLCDPEELLTRRITWTVTVPDP